MSEGSQVSGDDGAGRELAPRFTKHGGYRLPGLKHWRLRRGLRQVDLAQRTGEASTQLSKIELGRRGCNPALAQRLAEVLEVDLEDLRTKYDDAEEAQTASIPVLPTTAHRYVQRAYLRILLLRIVGSALSREEGELERHCQQSPWEQQKRTAGHQHGVRKGLHRSLRGGMLRRRRGGRSQPQDLVEPEASRARDRRQRGVAGVRAGHGGRAHRRGLLHREADGHPLRRGRPDLHRSWGPP